MKLVEFKDILVRERVVKLRLIDSNGYDFIGRICDLDDRYDNHEVINLQNIDEQLNMTLI